MKIGIACGGTGGHIFPGLAAGRVLRERGHEVVLWMAGRPGEDLALAGWDGPVAKVAARPLSSKNPFALVAYFMSIAGSVIKCHTAMRRMKPDVLLAMGSYASVAPSLGAALSRVPFLLHEANVIPGRAVRFLSRWAAAVAVSFKETSRHLSHRRIVPTGMPIRWSVANPGENDPSEGSLQVAGSIGTGRMEGLIPGRFTVLVMGGSRGARRLNEIAASALVRLYGRARALQVIHLAGRDDEKSVRQVYLDAGMPAAVFGFLDDMPLAYRNASVAVCRSGASTCAELSFFGVPALLVPYPFAIYKHQTANANALAMDGSADMCDEQILTADWLADYLWKLMGDPGRLKCMRESALKRFTPEDPASALADLVELIGRSACGGHL